MSSPEAPFEDVHDLFVEYNEKYFEGRLDGTTVEWSDRMTLCAGLCYLRRQGPHRYCAIRLSRHLLQYRPFSDTISTLLHEMIHAYLWLLHRHPSGRPLQLDRDGHGPDFLCLAARISEAERHRGVCITVYHSFQAEVNEARKHVWLCDGPCRRRPPFFGLVRRAMNRPPQPADRWWSEHQTSCGGAFTKIATPPEPPAKPARSLKTKKAPQKALLDYWKRGMPHFAKDNSEAGGIQCPACRRHLAKNADELNWHLDACLAPAKTCCPVDAGYAADDLAVLHDHIDECLSLSRGRDSDGTAQPRVQVHGPRPDPEPEPEPNVIDLT